MFVATSFISFAPLRPQVGLAALLWGAKAPVVANIAHSQCPLREWRNWFSLVVSFFTLKFFILHFSISQFLPYCVNNTLQIFPYQSVFKTNNPNTTGVQKRCSNLISPCTFKSVMPFPIKFNTQFSFRAIKIQDIVSDRMLFSPFTAVQSLSFKLCPKHCFFRSKISSQLPSLQQQFFFITSYI